MPIRHLRGWDRYLYSDDQPRDDQGQWTDGGGGNGVTSKSPGPVREKQFRGGVEGHTARVQYSTRNKDMAASYVDMSNDRFGSGASLHEVEISISNPAPASEIESIAKSIGIDNEFNTPASVFDAELHGRQNVDRLVDELERRGYDGAILPDIAYGTEIEDDAFISFSKKSIPEPPKSYVPVNRPSLGDRASERLQKRAEQRRDQLRRDRLKARAEIAKAARLRKRRQERIRNERRADGSKR